MLSSEEYRMRVSYVSFFLFVFVILFYVGTHLARGYSSGDPRNYYEYTQHNHKQSQQSSYIHTQCVVSGSTFFQAIQGCRAGFEHPITLAQHHHQTATEPPLHAPLKIPINTHKQSIQSRMIYNSILYTRNLTCIGFRCVQYQ